MYEKKLKAVTSQLLTSNGTSYGAITIADSSLLVVKQKILLTATTLPNLILEIKRVEDDGITIHLGPVKSDIRQRTNLSAYTTLLLSAIEAPEQERPSIPEEQVERLTYQEEPVVARRSFIVDCFGRPFTSKNPFPVQISDGIDNIEINTDGSINVNIASSDIDITTADILNSNTSIDGTLIVGVTPIELKIGANTLASRKFASLDNSSSVTIYWGWTNSITVATGERIYKDYQAKWSVGAVQKIYLIAATAGNTVRIKEGA